MYCGVCRHDETRCRGWSALSNETQQIYHRNKLTTNLLLTAGILSKLASETTVRREPYYLNAASRTRVDLPQCFTVSNAHENTIQ